MYDDGLLRLDSLQQQAWAAGVLLPLSRTEFRVLDRLVRHTGTVQHFGTLLAAGWGAASPGARDRVKFTVSRLRGKLDATPVGGGSIVSVRGMGYLYRSPTTPSLPPSPKPTAASTGYGHTRPARRVPRAGPCGGEVAGPDVSQRRRRLARWRQSTYPLVSHCSAVPLFR
ncbi:winged helix-turn-helix domain-containing protein [Streptomyces anulatus]